MRQHAFEIGKRNRLVDHKPFDLMKHRRMGRVVVVPIHRARHDDLQRRLAALHRADLHRRGVCSQQPAMRHEERILHIARRMVLGNIERLEVMVIVLNVGAAGNFKTHAPKNIDNFIDDERKRM